MDMETLKAELQHIFKELIGATLMKARDGKNSSYYSQLFEKLMAALDDYERLASVDEEEHFEEPPQKFQLNGIKINDEQPLPSNRNLKYMAEELLLKVEQLLQQVSEKERLQQRVSNRER